ncbi:MAG TPA: AI-2E family transporter [Burkholderiales bacterium]|nr:AI-2E family transporter [Burkholderiales bacterium]
MKFKLSAGWFYGALVLALAAWILHGFLEPLLAASVIAIASWPLYERFAARLPRRVTRGMASLMFTCGVTVFVLGPLIFAFLALLSESHVLLRDVALADEKGLPVPPWLDDVPFGGAWLAARWESRLSHPGVFSAWAERADPAALLTWAQSFGRFTFRHTLIVLFTILLLFLLYRDGASVAREFRQALRRGIGERAESYLDAGTRAVRASVNSLLVLGLFDGIASSVAYVIAGVPHAAVWGAITGALALVPFLGYTAVLAVTLHLVVTGAATPALLALGLGCAVLFVGDKVVRPVVAREGTHLPFAWVLMGCLGGFEVLGPVGLVIGPVALTLARELWSQRIRDLARDSSLHDGLMPINTAPQRRDYVGTAADKPHAHRQ